VSDHLFGALDRYGGDETRYGALEPLTTLAALAPVTERVRLGTLVLSATMRAPALVAHTFASLEQLAPGRVVAGLGAGWYEPEHRAFGLRLPSYRQRVASLDIASRAIASLEPDRRPSVLVGGTGTPVVELAARIADAHNVAWDLAPDALDRLNSRLDRACERAGRDPSTLARTIGLTVAVGRDDRHIEDAITRLRSRASFLAGVDRDVLAERIIVGRPDECAERIAAYRADEVVVALLLRDDPEMLEVLATEVAPQVR
jgi:alkanesulfonate monooxygenase SsuD/methylene tetrahydromethanopterin reductase-like flavin-dependent oxidoreductase (luciferase family)